MKPGIVRTLCMWGIALWAASAMGGATNPVTGKKQFVLMSEAQEIELGREADKDVAASIGLYPDEKTQQYVQALGARLAATTERPTLPWTFRVVDDATVNAFAIPPRTLADARLQYRTGLRQRLRRPALPVLQELLPGRHRQRARIRGGHAGPT